MTLCERHKAVQETAFCMIRRLPCSVIFNINALSVQDFGRSVDIYFYKLYRRKRDMECPSILQNIYKEDVT